MRAYNDFLRARLSFLEGMAHIFDFGGALTEYNGRRFTGPEADAEAIRSDWAVIGQDMRAAIGAFEAELEADASKMGQRRS